MEIWIFLAQSLLLTVALYPQLYLTTEIGSKVRLQGSQYDRPMIINKINTIRPPPL